MTNVKWIMENGKCSSPSFAAPTNKRLTGHRCTAAIEADAGEVGLGGIVVVFNVAVALELRLKGDGLGGVAVAERALPCNDACSPVRDGRPDARDVELRPATGGEESV